MTEPESLPPPPPAPLPPLAPSANTMEPPRSRSWLTVAIAVAALLAAGWAVWETRGRLDTMQEQLAKRLSESDTAARDARAIARQQQELTQTLQTRIASLESRLLEAQGQREAIESLYQELLRSRDDRLLAEIEATLAIAVQQLQLAGNVQAALAALQNIDTRLARADQGQFLPLRKAINHDIEVLKALPLVDVSGLSLRIDAIASAIDALPLAFEAKPRPDSAERPAAGEAGFFRALAADLWSEIRQLVRIERLDRPDPALLSPQHTFVLREHVKLRLLNARLALLQREGRVYRGDLEQARAWLVRYFDTGAPVVASAIGTLQSLAQTELKLELPQLAESTTALHGLKATRERALGLR